MDSLERRDVHKPGGVSQDHDAIARAALRQREIAAFRDRLGAPLHHLTAGQQRLEEPVLLESLQQEVHVEVRIAGIEPHHQPQRDEIRLERIDEAAAKRIGGQRPA